MKTRRIHRTNPSLKVKKRKASFESSIPKWHRSLTQDNFRRSIVAGAHHRGMIFPLKGRTPKVDQPDIAVV